MVKFLTQETAARLLLNSLIKHPEYMIWIILLERRFELHWERLQNEVNTEHYLLSWRRCQPRCQWWGARGEPGSQWAAAFSERRLGIFCRFFLYSQPLYGHRLCLWDRHGPRLNLLLVCIGQYHCWIVLSLCKWNLYFSFFVELMSKVKAQSNKITEHTAMVVSCSCYCCNCLSVWNWWKTHNVNRRLSGGLIKREVFSRKAQENIIFLLGVLTTIVTIYWTGSAKDTALLRIALSIPPWYRCKWILIRMLLIKTYGVYAIPHAYFKKSFCSW